MTDEEKKKTFITFCVASDQRKMLKKMLKTLKLILEV